MTRVVNCTDDGDERSIHAAACGCRCLVVYDYVHKLPHVPDLKAFGMIFEILLLLI